MYDVWVEQDSWAAMPDPALLVPPDAPITPTGPEEKAPWADDAFEAPAAAHQAGELEWAMNEDPFLVAPTGEGSGPAPALEGLDSPAYVPPTTDLGEIVVTGDREGTFWWFNGGNWSWHVPSSGMIGDGPMPDGYYEPPVQDPEPPVSHDGQPESIAAAAQLAQVVRAVDEEIDKIPDTRVFQLPDGRTITGAEIKAIWNNMSFKVTHNVFYGDGRAGANVNGVVSINAAAITGYAAHGAAGTNYLMLHEIAHVTPAGQAYDAKFLSDYKSRTGDKEATLYGPAANEFKDNERYANEIARIVSTGTLLSFMPAPPHGYPGAPT